MDIDAEIVMLSPEAARLFHENERVLQELFGSSVVIDRLDRLLRPCYVWQPPKHKDT